MIKINVYNLADKFDELEQRQVEQQNMLEYLVASERRKNNGSISVANQANASMNNGYQINTLNDIVTTNTVLSQNIYEVPEVEERSNSGSQNEPRNQEEERALQLQEIQFQMQETQLRFDELRRKQNELKGAMGSFNATESSYRVRNTS